MLIKFKYISISNAYCDAIVYNINSETSKLTGFNKVLNEFLSDLYSKHSWR